MCFENCHKPYTSPLAGIEANCVYIITDLKTCIFEVNFTGNYNELKFG